MPNADNITRPITLVSYGRSGTSLVHRVLGSHPDVDACGETQPLIFGTWEATSRVRNVIRRDIHLPQGVDFDERCAKAVRAVFLGHFDAPGKPRWAHKPINLPYTFERRQKDNPRKMDRALDTYWPIMTACFPQATNITVLRHPYDVALSAQAYWGHPIERIWRHVVRMAQVIDHPDSPIRFAVSHARMSQEPEPEIARLLDHVGLSHDPACFAAATKVYVSAKGAGAKPKAQMTDHVERAFSHRDRWSELDRSSFTDADHEVLTRMWARFDETLTF